jgi:hypothetical protein
VLHRVRDDAARDREDFGVHVVQVGVRLL